MRNATATVLPQRFWWLLSVGVLAWCGSYAALVLRSATWAEVQQLARIYPDEGMCLRQFGPRAWQHAQHLAATGASLLLGLGLALGPGTRAGRVELRALGAGLRQLGRRIGQAWALLTPGQRRFFGAHLALLTAVRLYLSWTLLWHDDAASFELFVQHGWLAVAAYYPVPNNHVLSNTLGLGLSHLYPGFWWSMRLQVVLTSTVGTVLLFGVLLRRLGYWPALLAAGATSWLNPSLYFAGNGRGYWLILVFTSLLFWALLTILSEHYPGSQRPGAGARLRGAWLVLVGAGVLGCYAVPTFAYVLASGWSWLGGWALCRRQWGLVWQAGGMGALVLVGAGLLYGPVLYVSGLSALVGNPYVQPLAGREFWQQFPAYAWFTESYLGGQFHLGALVTLAGVSVVGWLLWRRQAGQLPAERWQQVREVGLPALWFVACPYLLLSLQHVLPPERTLLYKAWFVFILVALGVADWRVARPRAWLLGLGAGLFIGYQLTALLGDARRLWLHTPRHRVTYGWFSSHPQVFFPAGRKLSTTCCCAEEHDAAARPPAPRLRVVEE